MTVFVNGDWWLWRAHTLSLSFQLRLSDGKVKLRLKQKHLLLAAVHSFIVLLLLPFFWLPSTDYRLAPRTTQLQTNQTMPLMHVEVVFITEQQWRLPLAWLCHPILWAVPSVCTRDMGLVCLPFKLISSFGHANHRGESLFQTIVSLTIAVEVTFLCSDWISVCRCVQRNTASS